MPYSYFEWLQGFFIVHSTIESAVHSAFEKFGALQMHNHDDKNPARPGFEPDTSRLQAHVNTNEPSGPAMSVEECPLFYISILFYSHPNQSTLKNLEF